MKARITVLVALAILLVSCGPTALPGFSLEYQRTGGIAGFNDRLTIDEKGNATLSRRGQTTQFILDRETISQLQTLLDQANFVNLNNQYLPQGGADLFQYTITYGNKTVQTADTAVPAKLQPALDLLNRIVDKGGQP